MMLPLLVMAGAWAAGPALDYEFFRDRVQPIFLKKRSGHGKCVSCHTHRIPQLQPLAGGAEMWDEAASKKNFAMWSQFVVPGNPAKSKMLLHPLSMKAGGDHFHAGGRHWLSKDDPEWRTLAAWVNGATKSAAGPVTRVLQTNSAGDNIHLIDPATNEVVNILEDIELPHGVAISPDGMRLYVTNEARVTLDVVDAPSLTVFKRIPLTGRPNNVAVTKDGNTVYVGIREAPGAVDVVDARSLTRTKSIATKGAIHNVYVTPDGKYAAAGSIEGKTLHVIDVATNQMSWILPFDAGIRPMEFTVNADGSTKEIVVQLSDYHGLSVVDFASRKELKRVVIPDPPGKHKETEGLQGSPAHGLAITPDGKLLWSTSKYYGAIAAFSLPDYKFVKMVYVGSHPDWLTIPPDGKNVYVGVAGDDTTVVVDNKTFAVVKTIRVGAVPKRNASGVLRTR